MRAVTGPLETGTYVGYPVTMPEEFAAAKKDSEGTRYVLTSNTQHEGMKWQLEKIGNDIFRCMNKNLNISPSASPQTGSIEITEGPATTDWIIKETDVNGEYYASPVGHPASFASIQKGSGEAIQAILGSEKMRFKAFRVDE
ncbi:hypothetical protein AX15_005956 [Amanita polypyramis BW_CC]|nr:hypothetical protein AX15_005956 [Amanita polypyramis BW_CC]